MKSTQKLCLNKYIQIYQLNWKEVQDPPRVLPTLIEGIKCFLDCLGSRAKDNDTTTIYSSSSCNLYFCTSLQMLSIVTAVVTIGTTNSYHYPFLPLFSVLSTFHCCTTIHKLSLPTTPSIVLLLIDANATY